MELLARSVVATRCGNLAARTLESPGTYASGPHSGASLGFSLFARVVTVWQVILSQPLRERTFLLLRQQPLSIWALYNFNAKAT